MMCLICGRCFENQASLWQHKRSNSHGMKKKKRLREAEEAKKTETTETTENKELGEAIKVRSVRGTNNLIAH
jgi:hypothetical protein